MKRKVVEREDLSEAVAALGVVGREAGGSFVPKKEPFLLLLGSKFLKYSSIYDFPK